MEHPPKRRRLFRAARNGGAIGANSKGGDGGIESHMARTDDAEGVEYRDLRFVEPPAASPVELRHQTPHTAKVVSVDRAEAIGARYWGLRRRFAQDSPVTLTEVISISVVVDNTGNTQTVVTLPTVTSDSSAELPTVSSDSSAELLTVSSDSSAQLPTVSSDSSAQLPTVSSDSSVQLSTASSDSSAQLSTVPSTSTLPTVTTFLITATSSPTVSPTSSSNFSSFGNSTSTEIGRNSSDTVISNFTTGAYTTSLNSTRTSCTTSITSTEVSTTSSTETEFFSPTVSSGNGWSGGGPATSSGTSSTPTSGPGSVPGTGLSTRGPAIIGGLVGGLAGIALILILILLFIRSRKGKLRERALEPGAAGEPSGKASGPWFGLVGILKRFRPASPPVEASEVTPSSERGFYKVSGRKISPVLGGRGGDGFGGGGYDRGTLGGPGGPHVARPPDDRGVVAMRPSPARMPVVHRSPTRESSHGRPTRPFRDALGRSHPSEDGSKASRFVEDV